MEMVVTMKIAAEDRREGTGCTGECNFATLLLTVREWMLEFYSDIATQLTNVF